MADGVKPRIKLPKTISAGDTITVKTLITHRMESGQRVNALGLRVPRSIIHRFHCAFEGETVVDMAVGPGVSTNPFFEFQFRVPGQGGLVFSWYDDDGAIYTERRDIALS
ncbi:MAG: thiosulfate oxidation carrier complex protein SoxZ [Ruegeria sp.]